MITIDSRKSALVLIDLQEGILALETVPRPSGDVLATCKTMAEQFREFGAPVVLVNVAWSADFSDAPPGEVDLPAARPEGGLPERWADLTEGLSEPGDIRITKRQWGAFTGTELDLQLRRRGIDTLVIAGIATNLGVESTVRHAWELGYNVVVVEDGCATATPVEMHDFAFAQIFPRIARVVRSDALKLG